MNFGVILPHTKLYGGVKRFLELGNALIDLHQNFTVYTPEGKAPDWFHFNGATKSFDFLKEDLIDVLFTTESPFIDVLCSANAKHKVCYHVRITENMRPFLKQGVEIFACSTNIYLHDREKYGNDDFKAFGGVNIAKYKPKFDYHVVDRPFCVMAYGRLVEHVKGTKYVVKACEQLYKQGYNIRLLLFDTAVSEKARQLNERFTCGVPFDFVLDHPFERNSELFNRADLFVAAERHAGWSNTVCEAMACALPVIATKAGTKDMLIDEETGLLTHRFTFLIRRKIKRMIEDEALRQRLGTNARRQVQQFDWHKVARRILAHFNETTDV